MADALSQGGIMVSSANVAVSEDFLNEVFELLKEKGSLCVSQVARDLALPPGQVAAALNVLRDRGIAEIRPDRDKTIAHDDDALAPWGLSTSFRPPKPSSAS